MLDIILRKKIHSDKSNNSYCLQKRLKKRKKKKKMKRKTSTKKKTKSTIGFLDLLNPTLEPKINFLSALDQKL